LINVVRADLMTAEEWLRLAEVFSWHLSNQECPPYMHLMITHLPEFLHIHWSISLFTQKNLEKLNDVYTQLHFNRNNHKDMEALKQILLRKNRLEFYADSGYESVKHPRNGSLCTLTGHYKCTCSSQRRSPDSTR